MIWPFRPHRSDTPETPPNDAHDPCQVFGVFGPPEAIFALQRKLSLLSHVMGWMAWKHEDELAGLVTHSPDPEWAAAVVADIIQQVGHMRAHGYGDPM